MIRTTNRRMDEGTLTPSEAQNLLQWLAGVNSVLGFETEAEAIPAAVNDLLTRRAEARTAKEWKLSDTLRDEILAAGWIVKDTKEGQKLTPAPRGGA
jgi:cysteinyl-tRNA synthetase